MVTPARKTRSGGCNIHIIIPLSDEILIIDVSFLYLFIGHFKREPWTYVLMDPPQKLPYFRSEPFVELNIVAVLLFL